MRYKTIMIDVVTYSKLSAARAGASKEIGSKVSFNDFIMRLISSDIDLVNMEEELRQYIKDFADAAVKTGLVNGLMLYGSVAKGTYNEHSDIDIFIIAKPGAKGVLSKMIDISNSMKRQNDRLIDAKLPSLISPVIAAEEDLKTFNPLYLDIVDYGMVLYEHSSAFRDFISSMRRMKHKRELVNNVEVLSWQ
jgi:predicted nucleotidyltransferase